MPADGSLANALERLPPRASVPVAGPSPAAGWRSILLSKDRRFDALRPLRVAALVSLVLFLACHVFQILSQRDVYFVGKMILGNDFLYFHTAARAIHMGANPYLVEGFVTPPTFAWLVYKLGIDTLPFERAAVLVFWANLAALCLSTLFSALLLWEGRPTDRQKAFSFAALLLATGFPAYFLVDRGNIDAFVLLPVVLALGLLAKSSKHGSWLEWLGGALLGVAIVFKVYPVLLLWPATLLGRFRFVMGAMLAVAFAVVLDPAHWAYFVFQRGVERSLWMVVDEGAGIFTFFRLLGDLFAFAGGPVVGNGLVRLTALSVFVGLFGAMSVALWHLAPRTRSDKAWRAVACFLPFAVSLPQVVYAYSLVQLLPFLFAVAAMHGDPNAGPGERRAWLVAAVGVALAQLQVKALVTVLPTGLPPDLVSGFCSIGLFVVVVATARARRIATRPVLAVREAKREARARNAAALWYP